MLCGILAHLLLEPTTFFGIAMRIFRQEIAFPLLVKVRAPGGIRPHNLLDLNEAPLPVGLPGLVLLCFQLSEALGACQAF